MGRVETRMYKRKQSRWKAVRRSVLLLLLAAAAAVGLHSLPSGFVMESLASPTATPLASAFDKTVESREVLLPAEAWYAIQTGVFSTEEAARDKAEAYADRGAPGTVILDGEKWRVFIACYGSEADASAVRTRLEENQKVDTYLYSWECPELRLRLTGMAGQLDVVEAGFTLLNSTASALRDAATAMDAGQITAEEAAEAVASLDAQIALWEDTVHKRFGKHIPPLVQGMLDVTKGWSARRDALQQSGGATLLSAELKSQAMDMFDDICIWRRNIAAQ